MIAAVDGHLIPYQDIRIDEKILRSIYPEETTDDFILAAKHTHESNQLRARVNAIITDRKISEIGMTVSGEEILSAAKESMALSPSEGWTSEAAIPMRNSLGRALERWLESPSQGDKIFQEEVSGNQVNYENCKFYQRTYDTREKVAAFKAPQNLQRMSTGGRDKIRKDLLYNKLVDFLAGEEVDVSDEEISAKLETGLIKVEPERARKVTSPYRSPARAISFFIGRDS